MKKIFTKNGMILLLTYLSISLLLISLCYLFL